MTMEIGGQLYKEGESAVVTVNRVKFLFESLAEGEGYAVCDIRKIVLPGDGVAKLDNGQMVVAT